LGILLLSAVLARQRLVLTPVPLQVKALLLITSHALCLE